MSPPQLRGPRRRGWASVGVVTLLTYNTWLLWWPLNGHVRILDGYLSELAASDQPDDLFFRGGDLLTAVLVLALAGHVRAGWRRQRARARAGAPRPSRWEALVWLGLALFGVATFLDAFFAMDCSPSLDEACRVAEETGRLSLVHYAHTWTSVSAQTGIVTSMVAGWLALRSRPPAWRRPRRVRVALVLVVLQLAGLAALTLLLALGLPGLGYPQAVMVFVASLWFAAVGLGIIGGPGSSTPPPGTGTATPTVQRVPGRVAGRSS